MHIVKCRTVSRGGMNYDGRSEERTHNSKSI